MKRGLLPLVWISFFVALAANLAFWGGIARVPDFGPRAERAASQYAFLAATYMGAGKYVVSLVDEQKAAGWARERVAHDWSRIASAPPGLMVERIQGAMPSWLRAAHYGAPVLLVIALVVRVFRPRPVTTLGRRR